ncbi:MAG: hypothetical protein KIH63_002920 [Candidatus Saccharibacteria bacterium]|nr:hypothetical protein [Candidatus Saccharibacteria bacterium]
MSDFGLDAHIQATGLYWRANTLEVLSDPSVQGQIGEDRAGALYALAEKAGIGVREGSRLRVIKPSDLGVFIVPEPVEYLPENTSACHRTYSESPFLSTIIVPLETDLSGPEIGAVGCHEFMHVKQSRRTDNWQDWVDLHKDAAEQARIEAEAHALHLLVLNPYFGGNLAEMARVGRVCVEEDGLVSFDLVNPIAGSDMQAYVALGRRQPQNVVMKAAVAHQFGLDIENIATTEIPEAMIVTYQQLGVI